MTEKSNREFFRDLEDFDTAMLVTRDGKHLRSRPMASYVDPDKRSIRFLTSVKTHKIEEIKQYPEANAVYTDDDDEFISVSGRLTISRDARDIDELWSAGAEAWINKDEAAVLILEADIAEYWNGDNMMKASWEMAKAMLTGDKPDVGDNETLTL